MPFHPERIDSFGTFLDTVNGGNMADWKERALEAERLLAAAQETNKILNQDLDRALQRANRYERLRNIFTRGLLLLDQWKEEDNAGTRELH